MRSSPMTPPPLILVLALLLLLGCPPAVEAAPTGRSRMRIGFETGCGATERARWSKPDVWQGRADGLGWRGAGRPTSPLVIQTTRPLALGFSDRPALAARIDARLTWRRPRGKGSQSTVFVRHSPDAHHWSTWQVMSRCTPACGGRAERLHLQLAIPRSTRIAYQGLLRGQGGLFLLPHGGFDEGMAAWYLQTETPGFIERAKPYLGYLQFLIETELGPRERLCVFDVNASWTTADGPRAADALSAGSWNWHPYRLGGLTNPASREVEVQAVLEAALDAAIAEAQPFPDPKEHPSLVLMDRTALSFAPLACDLVLPDRLGLPFAKLPTGLQADYRRRNDIQHALPPRLRAGVPITYWDEETHVAFLSRTSVWESFYAESPASLGTLWVSEPGFSQDGQFAAVHVGRMYGFLAGYGRYYLLQKKKGRWAVVQVKKTWIS